jgi:hypothetical protein
MGKCKIGGAPLASRLKVPSKCWGRSLKIHIEIKKRELCVRIG